MKIFFFVLIIGLLPSCNNEKKPKEELTNETVELKWLKNWFSAWELMSDNVLKLPKSNPPIMLFYDEKYVYTTSEIAAPNGEEFNGPKFFGEKLPWKKTIHNDTLTLPDGQRVPLQLMTFAAPSEQDGIEAFFVMAAPVFWKDVGIESKEISLDKLLTGVFLHEFTHTRQMDGIGSKITDFENNHSFKYEVSDDLIQDYFSTDSLYVANYQKEIGILYSAAAKDKNELHILTSKGLQLLKERQQTYLLPEKEILIEMDNIFLTMEGLGQYMIVAWLTHPKGGNIPFDIAVKAARRGGKWWSQDEGLALFLILDKLTNPNWEMMFGENPVDVIKLIEKEITVASKK